MQPLYFLPPVLYTLFLWWFVTGLVIGVYGRSPRVRHLFFGAITAVMLLAMGGLFLTRGQAQPEGVYVALTCGVLLWGWQVASYYLGYVTGPHSEAHLQRALPALRRSRPRWPLRFWHALQASLYHELFAIGFIFLLSGLTWNAPNKWGLWIFIALWLMHCLAKINVFLGVRNFRMDFLPVHLHYLDRLISKRANNPLLPVTIMGASVVSLLLYYQAIIPGTTPTQSVGFLAVGTMLALGVFEHLLLVIPMSAILWGWGLKPLPQPQVNQLEPDSPIKQPAPLRAMSEQLGEG